MAGKARRPKPKPAGAPLTQWDEKIADLIAEAVARTSENMRKRGVSKRQRQEAECAMLFLGLLSVSHY